MLIYFLTLIQLFFLSYAYSIVGDDSYIMKVLSNLFLWAGIFFAYLMFLPIIYILDKEFYAVILLFSPVVAFPVLKTVNDFRIESFRVKRIDTIAKTPAGKEQGRKNVIMVLFKKLSNFF